LINKYLINDLIKSGLWNKTLRDKIIIGDGSIQQIDDIPQNIKDLYKTVWEIKQKHVIDQAAGRGKYVCQSQSMNLYMEDPDFQKLTSMHFYAWSKGLKTGVYYLRSKPRAQTQKFTIDPSLMKKNDAVVTASKKVVCTDEVCTMCSA
jgi:ribonucleoside-diphosphate reductase alpha chain